MLPVEKRKEKLHFLKRLEQETVMTNTINAMTICDGCNGVIRLDGNHFNIIFNPEKQRTEKLCYDCFTNLKISLKNAYTNI